MPGARQVFGYAAISVVEVTDAALTAEAAEPPARHAHITGWPRDPDPALQAARHQSIAHGLALRAQLVLRD
jgi:hypothetical protein